MKIGAGMAALVFFAVGCASNPPPAPASPSASKARAVAMEQQAQELSRQSDDIERRTREIAPPPQP